MEKIKVLHIGIKNWPFHQAFNANNKRGGGMNKYCDLLINAYTDKVDSFVITQNFDQKKYEEYGSSIKVFRVNTFGGRKIRLILLNVHSFFKAIKVVRKYKIDIIHAHILPGIITAFLLNKLFRIPVVGTPYNIYDKVHNFPYGFLANVFEKYFYPKIDKLVFESEENKQRAIKILKKPFNNSLAINTGIQLPTNITENNIYQTPIRLLFIGRLVKVKALDNLILSFKYLNQEAKNKIHLDIIGEGEEFEYLKSLQKQEKLENSISIHGFVDDLNSYIKQANIFILPSHTEGLSIALLEAMANGLACIVNNYGVPFSDKEVFTMQNNKPETIADTLTKFVLNPELIKHYRDNAVKVIEKEFSVDAFANKYHEVYKGLN